MTPEESFFQKGWVRFPADPVLLDWIERSLPTARATVTDPQNEQWHRCGGTWFAGVNVLPNDEDGAVQSGPVLAGVAVDFIRNVLGLHGFAWDMAQISICYPGYPKPMEGEPEAGFRFRWKRDAAHIDGLLPEGPDRRRFLREYHGFVLGFPMADFSADASPFVVWEGSHEIVRAAFRSFFDGEPAESWPTIDVTERYHSLRREIFGTCPRVPITARKGEAYIVHRLALHGVAPWADGAIAGPDGRMIAYFRPDIGGPEDWLMAP